MFAIIQKGGKQYSVSKGQTIEVEKTEDKAGSTINLENVLLLSKDSDVKVGTPLVEGAYVSAKVVEHKKGEKIVVYKMKAKKRYQNKNGFRKSITTLEILDIHETGGNTVYREEKTPKVKPEKKAVAKKEPAKKAEKKPTAKKTTKKKVDENQASLI